MTYGGYVLFVPLLIYKNYVLRGKMGRLYLSFRQYESASSPFVPGLFKSFAASLFFILSLLFTPCALDVTSTFVGLPLGLRPVLASSSSFFWCMPAQISCAH